MNAIQETSGAILQGYDPFKFKVLVDTGTEDFTRLELFESWLSIWCLRNCSDLWSVSQNPDRTKNYQIVLKFADHREAVHFKLASGALRVTDRTTISSFMIH